MTRTLANIAFRVQLSLVACLFFLIGGQAFGQSVAAQAPKNSWTFEVERVPEPQGWLFVSIRPENGAWVIDSLDNVEWPRGTFSQDSPVEPFVVSKDFQRWTNYFTDNIGNCDSFAVQDSPWKTVCTSQFAGKNQAKAMIGILFGGSGVAGQRYDKNLVNAAINSIEPEDAARWLEKLGQ